MLCECLLKRAVFCCIYLYLFLCCKQTRMGKIKFSNNSKALPVGDNCYCGGHGSVAGWLANDAAVGRLPLRLNRSEVPASQGRLCCCPREMLAQTPSVCMYVCIHEYIYPLYFFPTASVFEAYAYTVVCILVSSTYMCVIHTYIFQCYHTVSL